MHSNVRLGIEHNDWKSTAQKQFTNKKWDPFASEFTAT